MEKRKKIVDILYVVLLFIIWFAVSLLSLNLWKTGQPEDAFILIFPLITFFFILFIIEKYDLGRKLDNVIKKKLNIYD